MHVGHGIYNASLATNVPEPSPRYAETVSRCLLPRVLAGALAVASH